MSLVATVVNYTCSEKKNSISCKSMNLITSVQVIDCTVETVKSKPVSDDYDSKMVKLARSMVDRIPLVGQTSLMTKDLLFSMCDL